MKRKNAFTLGEVLIALIIIGVLALVTLPLVAGSAKLDSDAVLFLKAFHALEAVTADVIKDPSRYDQDIDATSSTGFHQAPLRTAQVDFKNVTLTKNNAFCYFIAEQLNFLEQKCSDSGDKLNIRTANNVCYRNLQFTGSSDSSTQDVVVDIGCKNETTHRYVIRVSATGKLSVPNTSSLVNSKTQRKAACWIQNQDKAGTKEFNEQCRGGNNISSNGSGGSGDENNNDIPTQGPPGQWRRRTGSTTTSELIFNEEEQPKGCFSFA